MGNLGPSFWIPFILTMSIIGTVYTIFALNFVLNILIMALYLEQWKIISNSVGKVIMSIVNLVLMMLTQSVMMFEYGLYWYWQSVFIWADFAHQALLWYIHRNDYKDDKERDERYKEEQDKAKEEAEQ